MYSPRPKLPPEIVSLVLDALDEDDREALKRCSLTCTTWRALCLPALFDTLMVPEERGYLWAVSCFMLDAPHLRPYVRYMGLHGPFPFQGRRPVNPAEEPLGEWLDDAHFVSFLKAFPKLSNAKCSFNCPPLAVLAHALPQVTLTCLQLDHYSPSAHDLLRVLVAGSKTLRSVVLEYIHCHTPLNTTTQDITTTMMGALEELHVNYCSNLPLEGAVLQMPGLQRLFLGVVTPPSCLPDLLKTLGVDAYPDGVGPPSSKRFHVENICLVSPGYSQCLYEVRDTINRYTIPSSIRHIEILLFENVRTHPSPVEFKAFEAFLLALHERGQFSRLTVTMWGMPNAQAYSLSRFTQLDKRGLVELRLRLSSIRLVNPSSFLSTVGSSASTHVQASLSRASPFPPQPRSGSASSRNTGYLYGRDASPSGGARDRHGRAGGIEMQVLSNRERPDKRIKSRSLDASRWMMVFAIYETERLRFSPFPSRDRQVVGTHCASPPIFTSTINNESQPTWSLDSMAIELYPLKIPVLHAEYPYPITRAMCRRYISLISNPATCSRSLLTARRFLITALDAGRSVLANTHATSSTSTRRLQSLFAIMTRITSLSSITILLAIMARAVLAHPVYFETHRHAHIGPTTNFDLVVTGSSDSTGDQEYGYEVHNGYAYGYGLDGLGMQGVYGADVGALEVRGGIPPPPPPIPQAKPPTPPTSFNPPDQGPRVPSTWSVNDLPHPDHLSLCQHRKPGVFHNTLCG
ncbi:hypothetical protein AB1N83_006364 [Pleurotus pulmonarius]